MSRPWTEGETGTGGPTLDPFLRGKSPPWEPSPITSEAVAIEGPTTPPVFRDETP